MFILIRVHLTKDLGPSKTTLTEVFKLCQNDIFATTLLYSEVSSYYTWNTSKKELRRRVQGISVQNHIGVKASDALGRVYTVHVKNFECFCLRMLLYHVRGLTSFIYLKSFSGQEYQIYIEACEAQRLLENDNHWDETMKTSVQCQLPDKIRELYATLLSL